jgi:ubiquitin conjugation factor E4 B
MEKSRQAKGSLQLSNMVTQLLAKVTQSCQDPFISEELGEKFAQAVNFCLDQLTTQKGLKFKIKNPERFYFEPKELLVNLVTMYANMAHLEIFRNNVVKDGRSYSNDTFEKAVKILNSTKKSITVDPENKEKFETLAGQLKSLKDIAEVEDAAYDDAPEEFMDPLMFELMTDPVELPDSKTIIDRITISKLNLIILTSFCVKSATFSTIRMIHLTGRHSRLTKLSHVQTSLKRSKRINNLRKNE